MSIDRSSGVAGAGARPLPPTPGVRPVTPGTALAPVAPVAPRSGGLGEALLGRSGVSLGDLLLADDELTPRQQASVVAVEMGLERARGALVRQDPGEALAALDDIWHPEQASEEGWYLRAGALTALGLPGEGDRIAGDGLLRRPESRALRFVQSLARVLTGDVSGARQVLNEALERTPEDPVLLAQQAVLLARQGHRSDAREVLQRLQVHHLQHPATDWARRMVRSVEADGTRRQVREFTDVLDEVFPSDVPDEVVGASDTAPLRATDVASSGRALDDAFMQLGRSLVRSDRPSLDALLRPLIVACSAGGHLARSAPAEQVHAARSLLGVLLEQPLDTGSEASSLRRVLRPLLQPLLQQPVQPPMQSSSQATVLSASNLLVNLQAPLRRVAPSLPPNVRPLVEAMVTGALETAIPVDRSTPRANEPIRSVSGGYEAVLHEERDLRAPLLPVRLGLSLLEETASGRASDRAREGERGAADVAGTRNSGASPVVPDPWRAGAVRVTEGGRPGLTPDRQLTPVSVPGAELRGEGWGSVQAAQQAGAERGPDAQERSGRQVGLAAVLLVGGAIVAVSQGATILAVALGLGAAWVGVRRGGGRSH
ncbi:hypothetical protein [Gemmatimonas sp. UBA7669]|uniref:hypothetical protein n=1 Tax=Gemmatimonas sp. UBA7669 TaxID=1946568 RepID=UPI0025BDD69C|nr:hypothetical protein [Gemmatimonas sp. UBA7669]